MKSKSLAVIGTVCLGSFLTMSLFMVGCNSKPPAPRGEVDTFPLSGKVLVNGEAKPGVMVIMNYQPIRKGEDSPPPPGGKTNEAGEFKIKTYRTDDGAPAGDYVITFTWPDGGKNQLRMGGDYVEEDWFDGKLADRKTSTYKFTVKDDGSTTDMGTYELKGEFRTE